MMGQQRIEGLVIVWAKSYLEFRVFWYGFYFCFVFQFFQEFLRYSIFVLLMRVDINRRKCIIEYVYCLIFCYGNRFFGIRDIGFICQMERFIWRGIYCFYVFYVGVRGQQQRGGKGNSFFYGQKVKEERESFELYNEDLFVVFLGRFLGFVF